MSSGGKSTIPKISLPKPQDILQREMITDDGGQDTSIYKNGK